MENGRKWLWLEMVMIGNGDGGAGVLARAADCTGWDARASTNYFDACVFSR